MGIWLTMSCRRSGATIWTTPGWKVILLSCNFLTDLAPTPWTLLMTAARLCRRSTSVTQKCIVRTAPRGRRREWRQPPGGCRGRLLETELTGGLFYVNYGRVEDFQVLRSQAINVSAALVIVRAGQISFAEKVNNAEEAGAVGVLIFPENVESPVYGHVHFGTGDPNTPGFPSFNHTQFPPFRSSGLPKMLVQAISLSSARSLLGTLSGVSVPDNFLLHGLGPTLTSRGHKVRLQVHNVPRSEELHNVFGSITGRHEPEHYIVVGAQRDSWGPGAARSGVGTAILLELARTMAMMVHNGFQPRRTILFVSWDGGDFGSIGATEWLEGYLSMLHLKVAAYVSLDTPVLGDENFIAKTSPLFTSLIENIIKQVCSSSPHHGSRTLLLSSPRFPCSAALLPSGPTLLSSPQVPRSSPHHGSHAPLLTTVPLLLSSPWVPRPALLSSPQLLRSALLLTTGPTLLSSPRVPRSSPHHGSPAPLLTMGPTSRSPLLTTAPALRSSHHGSQAPLLTTGPALLTTGPALLSSPQLLRSALLTTGPALRSSLHHGSHAPLLSSPRVPLSSPHHRPCAPLLTTGPALLSSPRAPLSSPHHRSCAPLLSSPGVRLSSPRHRSCAPLFSSPRVPLSSPHHRS
ncbi:transferrin receptor protein 2 isoform X3 [Ranitomeya imitator]|uniref:transferrin receptor protein 2 isoform X3 n=1 Tax=Ranitomeya imitator TaxID=111125 RepID=UPI0037E894C8